MTAPMYTIEAQFCDVFFCMPCCRRWNDDHASRNRIGYRALVPQRSDWLPIIFIRSSDGTKLISPLFLHSLSHTLRAAVLPLLSLTITISCFFEHVLYKSFRGTIVDWTHRGVFFYSYCHLLRQQAGLQQSIGDKSDNRSANQSINQAWAPWGCVTYCHWNRSNNWKKRYRYKALTILNRVYYSYDNSRFTR